jgi:hypothetical protein
VIHHTGVTKWKITVQLCDGKGNPLSIAGVHLDVRFYTRGRFRYSFSLGATDVHGSSCTTFGELERQFQANRRFFLMDYNTPLSDCDTLVGVAAPTADELAEREAARSKWWPEAPPLYLGAANDRVRCREQKFQLPHDGSDSALSLVCELNKAV